MIGVCIWGRFRTSVAETTHGSLGFDLRDKVLRLAGGAKLSALLFAAAFALQAWIDLLLILVVTALVLVAEILNSAIEALCDFVETRHNEKIKVIKDIAAAAVGISILVWFVVLIVEASRFLQGVTPS